MANGFAFGFSHTIPLQDKASLAPRLQHNGIGSYTVRADDAQYQALLENQNPVQLLKANFVWELPTLETTSTTRRIIGAIETFNKNALVTDTRRRLWEMRRVAMTDPLTGVSNRRHLEGRLRAALAVVQNSFSVVGLLFMDVDHFKRVNDAYGHNIGDDVLRMVGNTLQYTLRATDTLGRWGGEEFIAIPYEVQTGNNL